MTKVRLANPCQNKESKQKKHDQRDKRNVNECLFNTSILFWNVADPVKPLNSYSAQINFDIEMVRAWPCMANTSCNWCQKKEDKLNYVTM